ncbi:hypothetical protein MRX96_059519 [Rhipicephalus microplus]
MLITFQQLHAGAAGPCWLSLLGSLATEYTVVAADAGKSARRDGVDRDFQRRRGPPKEQSRREATRQPPLGNISALDARCVA